MAEVTNQKHVRIKFDILYTLELRIVSHSWAAGQPLATRFSVKIAFN